MQFDSPWGRGFPGWHIECSAMSRKYLGDTFDIHTGGEDNIFPHHECEIAQSEAFTGRPFVKLWMHARHLLWDGKKMSKSEGTFYSIQDLLDRSYPGEAIRLALVTTHYRQQVNYTMKSFDDAKAAVTRLRDCSNMLQAVIEADQNGEPGLSNRLEDKIAELKRDFPEVMDEDLNTSGGIAEVLDYVRELNRILQGVFVRRELAQKAKDVLSELAGVFGINLADSVSGPPADVESLVRSREDARKRRDWKESDRLRDEIQKRGWTVKDTKDGTKVSKA
jgi:cysteinyl-tRNA synthetase